MTEHSHQPAADINQEKLEADMHPVAGLLFGWVSRPGMGRTVFWIIGGLAALLLVADLFVHRHTKEDIEKITGAYGIYGFLSFGFVVLMGWPLGRLLRRGEDYYADQEPDGAQTREVRDQ